MVPKYHLKVAIICVCISTIAYSSFREVSWESAFVKLNKDKSLTYSPDEKGNIIPDFSRVGYYGGDKPIPEPAVVKTVSPTGTDKDQLIIQAAIDEVAKRNPDQTGFRGAILIKKGVYKISENIRIENSGIVLRGEGDKDDGTKLIATSKKKVSLIVVSGTGKPEEISGTRVSIEDAYVPVGAMAFTVSSVAGFKKGDKVILFRPGTEQWIKDLKMDKIEARNGTRQWQAKEYDLYFQRIVTKIQGNRISIDNPVMMALDTRYGGGQLFRYNFEGRITNVGIENIRCESEYETDTSENHAWNAISFDQVEHGWVRNVTTKYFGYSCVTLNTHAKNISVLNSHCYEPKSVITGSRRYSFNNNGQLNLFMNCHTTEGRHDFVTGARVCGPNVFYNCTAKRAYADIGPHHRWAVGTLYDNIITDGEINVQDRGNWGSGHGWAGVTQVIWNCTVKRAAIQNPWTSGKNYCIGLRGEKYDGRLKGRPDAVWEGQNKTGLEPASLYIAQLKARKKINK